MLRAAHEDRRARRDRDEPRTANAPEHTVLALQRGAGNAAVARATRPPLRSGRLRQGDGPPKKNKKRGHVKLNSESLTSTEKSGGESQAEFSAPVDAPMPPPQDPIAPGPPEVAFV
jgi:hypothetical protein